MTNGSMPPSGVPTLVAADLDGTFLRSDGVVTERSQNAVRGLESRRIPFVLATGRPIRWLDHVLDQLPFLPVCVCQNGALIYDSYHRQLLHQVKLKPSTIFDIVHNVQRVLPEACFGVERVHSEPIPSTGEGPKEEFVVLEGCEEKWYVKDTAQESLNSLASQSAAKLLIWMENMTSAQMLEEIGDLIEPVASVTYSYNNGLLECANPVATKGEALARIMDYYDLSEESLVAFGNMPNDIDMLQLAGWGVAVENADPAVKDVADEVTLSNDEDGVAVVLERILNA